MTHLQYTNTHDAILSITSDETYQNSTLDDRLNQAAQYRSLCNAGSNDKLITVNGGTLAGQSLPIHSTYIIEGWILSQVDVSEFAQIRALTQLNYDSIVEKGRKLIKLNGNWCLTSELHPYRAFSHQEMSYYHPSDMTLLDANHYDEETYAPRWQTVENAESWDEYILTMHAFRPRYRDGYYHEDSGVLHWNDEHEHHVHEDDAVNVEDNSDYYHRDDVVYRHDLAYSSAEAARSDDKINDYHNTPPPELFIKADGSVLSNYTVGFEIEKSSVDEETEEGAYVDPQPLFAGWETDSSCGVEGITNVYSLNNTDLFLTHVKESDLLNEPTDRTCGGHINFGRLDNTLQYWHIKPWLGLFWSMWRKRLTNTYSCSNKKANPYHGSHARYSCLSQKSLPNGNKLYELRLPNRVSNQSVLANRFRLMQSFLHCVDLYLNEKWSYSSIVWPDDTYVGIPEWAVNNLPQGYIVEPLKAIEEFNVKLPVPVQLRMRFLIEMSKDVLLDVYGTDNRGFKLIDVIEYAYKFQGFIESESAEYTCPAFQAVKKFI